MLVGGFFILLVSYNECMKKTPLIFLLLLLFPLIGQAAGIKTVMTNIVIFINDKLITFLIGIAFVIFVANTIRYFIFHGGNKEKHEEAKNFMIYSVAAFVLMVIFWGIVNFIGGAIGLDGCSAPDSDYVSRNSVGPPSPFCP